MSIVPRTMFEKIWDRHVVEVEEGEALLYVDRALIHEVSSHTFASLNERQHAVRRPRQVFAFHDHYVPTNGRDAGVAGIMSPDIRKMVTQLEDNARRHGITLFGIDDAHQGIIHVVPPEQGMTLPGMLIVGSDSHTSTHGAFGSLAFGIGASQMMHVMATQTLWQRKPRTLRIVVDGALASGVSAKDVILAIIAQIGVAGAVGTIIEYCGSTISAMSMEARMTVCNMSIEAGGRAGMIAPDETTWRYIDGKPHAPKGAAWDDALACWETLASDTGAVFDRSIALDTSGIAPMVTWGTNPGQAAPITGTVPDPRDAGDPRQQEEIAAALDYMGLHAGMPLADIAVDHVFIGTCTNSRIEDLRAAAKIAELGHARVPAWVVPGSRLVKRQAEQEGLDRVFLAAGFEWRDAGCSMCTGHNGDMLAAGKRCASTSNRNFVGRQGPGARTHLLSPAMAAAAAIKGRLTDVREVARD